MWFGQNLNCLPIVLNLTLYSPEINSIRVLLLTSVKNSAKYVILLYFYVSLLQKHKKYKNIKEHKIKSRLVKIKFLFMILAFQTCFYIHCFKYTYSNKYHKRNKLLHQFLKQPMKQ